MRMRNLISNKSYQNMSYYADRVCEDTWHRNYPIFMECKYSGAQKFYPVYFVSPQSYFYALHGTIKLDSMTIETEKVDHNKFQLARYKYRDKLYRILSSYKNIDEVYYISVHKGRRNRRILSRLKWGYKI